MDDIDPHRGLGKHLWGFRIEGFGGLGIYDWLNVMQFALA